MTYLPLWQLKKGQYGIIRKITCSQTLLHHFLDLGFCEETPIQCVNTGIFHNPHAYKIRGSVLAIRNEDADFILIEPLAESCKVS